MAEITWPARNLLLVVNSRALHHCAIRSRFLLLVIALGAFVVMFIVTVFSFPKSSAVDITRDIGREGSSVEILRVNLLDMKWVTRSSIIGRFRDQFPLSTEEMREENEWRSKILGFDQNANYCNQFDSDPNKGAVMQLSDFVVKLPKPQQVTDASAEKVVEDLLLRDGYTVRPGGAFTPEACLARETVAIVVPYRDRFENLMTFLNYMHRYLQRQRRRYLIVVAEQVNHDVFFNRAKLFNVALRELLADNQTHIDCFVLHDVDKVPYHLFNLYACGFQPRQIATIAWNSSSNAWQDYYPTFLGGVTAFSRWQLLRMNGASNSFYGWGAEDDDMYGRSLLTGFVPSYPAKHVGRMWVMNHHDDMKKIAKGKELLWTDLIAERLLYDGLRQAKYVVREEIIRPLYTKISVVV